jgi:molybdenum cofactor synthesis domain-containing protein
MSQAIKVLSVNISEKKGTIKTPVEQITLKEIGVVGDAHSGNWHRQVSLLAKESIDKFSKEAGRKINHGEFAENITTEGLILHKCKPMDRFLNNHVELEVTQIGKKCHGDNCNIFKEIGNCVMPKEGIFAKVLKHGELKAGDVLEYKPKVLKILIITLSDRASRGEYQDKSGPQVKRLCNSFFTDINRAVDFEQILIPDNSQHLEALIEKSVHEQFDVIFTTGGTGIGTRDITPDTIKPLLDKEIPGIMEMIRLKYGMEKPAALLSRSIAGVIKQTLIYTLPGSVRAVNEYCKEILPTIEHSLYMIYGIDSH